MCTRSGPDDAEWELDELVRVRGRRYDAVSWRSTTADSTTLAGRRTARVRGGERGRPAVRARDGVRGRRKPRARPGSGESTCRSSARRVPRRSSCAKPRRTTRSRSSRTRHGGTRQELPPQSGAAPWMRSRSGTATTTGSLPTRRADASPERARLRAFAALDFHTRRQFFPLAVIMEVAEPFACSGDRTGCSVPAGFRAEAFGVSVLRFTGGLAGTALRSSERLVASRGPVRGIQRTFGRD